MRWLCLLGWIASAAFAEIPVSDPVFGPPPGSESSSVVASDGDGFFVIWRDNREGPVMTYGARVSARGEVLDPLGIWLSDAPPLNVAYGGGRYLVLCDRELIWVTRDGGITARRAVPSGGHVAFNGREFVHFQPHPRGLAMQFLDRDGDAIGDAVITAAFRTATPAAFSGSTFLLLLDDYDYVYATLVGATGRPIADRINLGPRLEGGKEHDATWNGREFVIAFHYFGDSRNNVQPSTHVVRLGENGDVRAGGTLGPKKEERIAVTQVDGAAMMLSIGKGQPPGVPVIARRLDGPSMDRVIAADAWQVAVGSNGRAALAVISTWRDGNLEAVLLDGGAEVVRRTLLTRSAPGQFHPAIARSAGGTLVAWHEERGDREVRLMATIIDPVGHRMLVDFGPAQWIRELAPAVASDGGEFVVVASRASELLVLRLDARAEVLARSRIPATFVIGTSMPRVVCPGGPCVVTWTDARFRPVCASVDRYGSVSESGPCLPGVTFPDPQTATYGGTTLRTYARPTRGEWTGGSTRVFFDVVR